VIESSAVAILATGGQAPAWKERPPTTSGVPTASRRHTGGGGEPPAAHEQRYIGTLAQEEACTARYLAIERG